MWEELYFMSVTACFSLDSRLCLSEKITGITTTDAAQGLIYFTACCDFHIFEEGGHIPPLASS